MGLPCLPCDIGGAIRVARDDVFPPESATSQGSCGVVACLVETIHWGQRVNDGTWGLASKTSLGDFFTIHGSYP